MRYLGGKTKISKHIVPIMESYRLDNQAWVEPFVGGCNTIIKVDGVRYANDIRADLITLWEKATYSGYIPPTTVTRDTFNLIKDNPSAYPAELRSFVSIGCSFSGIEWGSYANDKTERNYAAEASRGVVRKADKMRGVTFSSGSYDAMYIPPSSLIYCDPPYEGTVGYSNPFNHALFWDWCRSKAREGHTVFISEYNAPSDFIEVWSKDVKSTVSRVGKPAVERLFKAV